MLYVDCKLWKPGKLILIHCAIMVSKKFGTFIFSNEF